MISEFLKQKYVDNKCQIIVINHNGNITETNNHLFVLNADTHINFIHPFFETISYLLPDKNQEHVFNCINLEIGEVKGSYNIVFFSGNDELNPYLIFYDFTDNCAYLQTVAQRRNESVIALELQQLKEKQYLNEKIFKNKFLANISHDLKTPLSAVLGFLEILHQTPLNPEQIELINTIKKSGQHIKTMMDDLLDLSKIEAGELKIKYNPFEILELTNYIQKIYVPIMVSKNLLFTVNITPNIPPFLVSDKARILQIIINLLDNAFKFTHQGSVSHK
jgi:two-component system, sensor histidine kinase